MRSSGAGGPEAAQEAGAIAVDGRCGAAAPGEARRRAGGHHASRHQDRRAAEVQRQAGGIEHHLDDVRVVELGDARPIGCAAVLITQSAAGRQQRGAGVDQRRVDQRLVAPHVDDDVAVEPSSAQASARRSLPVAWSARQHGADAMVCRPATMFACRRPPPRSAPTTAQSARCDAHDHRQPAMSASGLLGSRVEASRAGIRTMKCRHRRRRRRRFRAQSVESARFAPRASPGCRRAPGKRQGWSARQTSRGLVGRRAAVFQRTLADRADQQFEQTRFHGSQAVVCGRGGSSAISSPARRLRGQPSL